MGLARSFGAIVIVATLASAPVNAHSEKESGIKIAPVASYKLPDLPGKSVTMVRVTFPPGSKDGPHRHAGTVTVYVLSGSIRTQIDDGPVETFKAGETFFEKPGVVHSLAENASATEPAEILAVFVADDGATLTTPLAR